jgi:hypothetical protein
MNKVLLLLAFTTAVTFSSHAQSTDTTSDPGYSAASQKTKRTLTPTERAARLLNILQKKLSLNQDQVIKLRLILISREAALDSLRPRPAGDKQADNQARRTINQDADGKIYALLTTDQQVLYSKWKQDLQLRRKMNRNANNSPQ